MAVDIATLMVAVDSSQIKLAKDELTALNSVSRSVEGAVGSLNGALIGMGAAFASWKAIEYVKDTALLAARYETLGVAMNTIGTTAGYSLTDLNAYETALRGTGITALASREAIVKLAAANVDLDKATRLARAAQDIAIINNLNSSDAFNKMVQGIQTGQVRLLHSMGIMATFQEAYKTMAHEIGKTTSTLTDYEKVQARTNIVLEYAEKLAGAYEAAMGTVGKQFRSMERYAQDLQNSMGAVFAPALLVIATALNDMFAKMAQSMAMARASGDFKDWQDSFAKLASAVVAVTKFINDHRVAIVALVVTYSTLSIINTLIPVILRLMTAWGAAVAATVVMDATLGTVVVSASRATAAFNIMSAAVTAAGGPWVILAAVVVGVAAAWYLMSDSLTDVNNRVAENVRVATNNIGANKTLMTSVLELAKEESKAVDQKKWLKEHEEDLAIAKLKILGMGPEYNNILITEAKNVKDLAQGYALITAQGYEQKIKSAEALIVSLKKEMSDISPSFWLSLLPGSVGYEASLKKIADAQKEVNKKIAEGNTNLAFLQQALKDLNALMKGGMKSPDAGNDDDKKALMAARKLEDDRLNLKLALARANKAEGDEEKRNQAVLIANLELEGKIKDIKRQFQDGKVAGGKAALDELIEGWTRVRDLTKDSADRTLTDAEIKRAQGETKKMEEANKALHTVMDQVNEVIDGGYAKSINNVVREYDNFRNVAAHAYDLAITKAQQLDFANGQVMGPETIKVMTEFANTMNKINAAGTLAKDAVVNQNAQTQANAIKTHLADLEKKHGAMNFDESTASAAAFAKQMGYTKEALKKFNDEARQLEAQRGNIWGGLAAGVRDFGKSATDVFENVRKASAKWLDGLSTQLTTAIMTGKANFGDFAKSVISDIINMIIKAMLFQAVISGMKAMGMDTSWLVPPSTKASGGGVNAGQPYLVGENGPELFMPTGSGNVVNNPGGMGGMRDINLSLTINSDGSGGKMDGSDHTGQQIGLKILQRVREIVVDEIQVQKRTGNSLNPIGAR